MSLAKLIEALSIAASANSPHAPVSRNEHFWRASSYLLGLMIAFGLSVSIFNTPFQVSDNIAHIRIAYSKSWKELFEHTLVYGQVRPMLWATVKIVYELSQGHVFIAYKIFHCFQVFLVAFLLVRLFSVRSLPQLMAASLALVVFIGIHTFAETVTQAYPVNSHLTIILCCLINFNLLRSKGGWQVDIAAVFTFLVALFTVETGALAGLILFSGFVLGYRGVSRWAFVGLLAVIALYIVAAIAIVQEIPTSSRGIGFGLSLKSPEELSQIIGDSTYLLYLYNVASAALSVLFSEPRDGIWRITNHVLNGGLQPWMLIQAASSCILTAVIAWAICLRFRFWLALSLTEYDRLILMALLILAGNSLIGFGYSYDAVLGVAGAFYAIAAFAACAILFEPRTRPKLSLGSRVIIVPLLLAMTLGWSARAVGLHHQIRLTAWKNQQEWPRALEHLQMTSAASENDPFKAFVLETRQHSLEMPVKDPFFWARGLNGYFED